MGYTVIAPLGDNKKALFVGIREFSTDEVYLLTPKERLSEAKEIKQKLAEFEIPVYINEIKEELMQAMFYQFARILKQKSSEEVIVNVASGDKVSACAALSAAFANGLKAFGISSDNEPMLLPIMKLSYYHEIGESKRQILKALSSKDWSSVKKIESETKFSKSLISYHVHGTQKVKGLLDLRVVDAKKEGKQLCLKRSSLGDLLLRGYLD